MLDNAHREYTASTMQARRAHTACLHVGWVALKATRQHTRHRTVFRRLRIKCETLSINGCTTFSGESKDEPRDLSLLITPLASLYVAAAIWPGTHKLRSGDARKIVNWSIAPDARGPQAISWFGKGVAVAIDLPNIVPCTVVVHGVSG